MTARGAVPRPARGAVPRPARIGAASPSARGAVPRLAPALDSLVHPMPLATLAVLLVNDHVLKPTYPSLLTGKLSGAAVLVLLPFVLLAAWDLVRLVRPGLPAVGPRLVVSSVVVTMVSYVAIEVVPFASDLYRMGLGLAQWPFRALLAMAGSAPVPAVAPVQLWSDPSDLLIVPVSLVVLAVGPLALRSWTSR
jgi:hypothetical protein